MSAPAPDVPPPGAHARAIDAAYAVLFAAAPLLAVFAHRGFAPLMLVAGVLAATRGELWRLGRNRIIRRPDLRDPLTAGALAVLALSGWIAASGLWSPQPAAGKLALNVAGAAFACGAAVWAASGGPRPRLAALYAGAVILGAALLFIESRTGGLLRALAPPADLSPERHKDITALGRGLTALAPAVFPAAALVHLYAKGRMRAPALAPVALVALALAAALGLTIAANVAALAAGALAAALALAAPRRVLGGLFWLALGLLAAAPLLAAALPAEALATGAFGELPLSWLQRLFIWRAAGGLALDCLPWGCGADFARAYSAAGATVSLPGAEGPVPLLPIHPHSVFLQIWLELGLPGAALFGVVLIAGFALLARADPAPPLAAALAGAAAAVLVSAAIEASLWQVWRLAAVGFAGIGVMLTKCIHDRR
ncbi:O-antigen ligase family protein [Amphiplicatus metriothermophilus]|uniref:O-antigen ligase n=1 Tax=Amphiplicatus metriothermophilus TaxID=1519374 RepID=A0A239PKQ8_9PROT|nr:O-antigen ligase family protein [Amphiplicatus metriothermophilus]MBB5517777.1 O-antigen ligase [Amphiplicatus metriothermophilus]SNT67889.1 O-antigen ligase [Amphiplicatus metriothermophilus]